MTDPDLRRLSDEFLECSRNEQREHIGRFVAAARPFGLLDASVVDPEVFERAVTVIGAGLADNCDEDDLRVSELLAALDALPIFAWQDEPVGLGWYVCGAVSELIYAAHFLQRRPGSAHNALKRITDLLDGVDQDTGTRLYPALAEAMSHSLAQPSALGSWPTVFADCERAAACLTGA